MKKREVPAATQLRFEEIAEGLTGRGVSPSQMFEMPCLKVGGKAFAGVYGGSLVFKLTGDEHAAALNLGGAVRSVRHGSSDEGVGRGAVRSREAVGRVRGGGPGLRFELIEIPTCVSSRRRHPRGVQPCRSC